MSIGPLHFCGDRFSLRPEDRARRRDVASGCRRRAGNFRNRGALLDVQKSRRDHAGDLCVTKLGQQIPNVAVDRFSPDVVALVEVAADDGPIDPVIQGGAVQRQQATFADTDHGDRQIV